MSLDWPMGCPPEAHPPQPCTPEIIGRAPGEKVKGGGGKGGDASPPEDSRVSCRIRPLALAHLILKQKKLGPHWVLVRVTHA
eukprot:scaffold2507_cov122-Isochrysis_galbana.AAC.25